MIAFPSSASINDAAPVLKGLALVVAGFIAGGMNALAGGGSFVSFPMMVWAGLPAVVANASSTVALVPGALTSAWAFRRDVRGIGDVPLSFMFAASMIGGGLGALLLLLTPESVSAGSSRGCFSRLVWRSSSARGSEPPSVAGFTLAAARCSSCKSSWGSMAGISEAPWASCAWLFGV